MKSRRKPIFLVPVALLALAGMVLTIMAQSGGQSLAPIIMSAPASGGQLVVRINFQPAAAETPPGHLPDSGAAFGDRGNGFSYGWNADNSAATRERHSPLAPDQRHDTLIHLQKPENPDAVWEIALPPGHYDVFAAGGDPAAFDGHMQTTAEGVLLIDGVPQDGRRFIPGLATARVTDGRLTVRSGPGAVNNKLLFLEIYRVAELPTPTPTQPAGMVEVRGVWVTRFDWTVFNQPASPARIEQIVNNIADAGFNTVFFQVRGTADAYYASGLEPWAQRVSGGALGQPPSPAWDPLATFVQRAHARGLKLHAYVNVYPVGDRTGTNTCPPPPLVSPRPLYFRLLDAHGATGDKLNAAQWTTLDQLSCGEYQMASPASPVLRAHFKAVVADLVSRYDIDGIHLDRIRYAGRTTSCDPVSEAAFGGPCFSGAAGTYEAWQRQQITTLVREIYQEVIVPAGGDVWLSAAVWPTYIDRWGWGYSEGYSDYYQDSQGWTQAGIIDAILPMIYSANPDTFRLERWQTLAADFQAHRRDRYVIPGIGSDQPSFNDIVQRIAVARALGVAGHALFSYGALESKGFFDDLRAGPYATPAAVPNLPWRD